MRMNCAGGSGGEICVQMGDYWRIDLGVEFVHTRVSSSPGAPSAGGRRDVGAAHTGCLSRLGHTLATAQRRSTAISQIVAPSLRPLGEQQTDQGAPPHAGPLDVFFCALSMHAARKGRMHAETWAGIGRPLPACTMCAGCLTRCL